MTRKRPTGDRARWVARAWSAAIILLVAAATLWPGSARTTPGPLCLVCGDTAGVDILLNVALFLPLGIALSLSGMRPASAIAGAFALSLSIETLQMSVVEGRDASLSDLVANGLGGTVGVALGAWNHVLRRPGRRLALQLAIGWSIIVALVQSIGARALVPAPTRVPYYGQLGNALGGHPPWPGRIISATIGSEPIPRAMYFDSRRPQALLEQPDGAPVEAVIVPLTRPEWVAPIVRVADVRRAEVLVLAQDGSDIVFGVRTHAAALRLRPFRARLFGALAGVASDTASLDTIRIEASHGRRDVVIAVFARDTVLTTRIPVTPGQVWRLATPIQTYATGDWLDGFGRAFWVFMALVPLAYWGTIHSLARGLALKASLTVTAAACSVVFFAAFVLLPIALGIRSSDRWEVMGCVAALAIGVGMVIVGPGGRQHIQ